MNEVNRSMDAESKLQKLKQENGWTGLTTEKKEIMKKQLEELHNEIDKLWKQHEHEPLKIYITDDSNQATHWRALHDEDNEDDDVTPGSLYRLYHDIYDDELVLFDDKGINSTIYLCHKGEWIIMEGSEQWHEYVDGEN